MDNDNLLTYECQKSWIVIVWMLSFLSARNLECDGNNKVHNLMTWTSCDSGIKCVRFYTISIKIVRSLIFHILRADKFQQCEGKGFTCSRRSTLTWRTLPALCDGVLVLNDDTFSTENDTFEFISVSVRKYSKYTLVF